jgi:hypothetical protein
MEEEETEMMEVENARLPASISDAAFERKL